MQCRHSHTEEFKRNLEVLIQLGLTESVEKAAVAYLGECGQHWAQCGVGQGHDHGGGSHNQQALILCQELCHAHHQLSQPILRHPPYIPQ